MTWPSTPNGLPRRAFWLGLLIALACAGYATWVRLGQLDTWKSQPAVYFPGGVPAMTTLDAYYSLRWAQAHLSGTYRPEADDPLRRHQTIQYPVGVSKILPDASLLDWRPRREPLRLPALSWMLAAVQPYTGSVEVAGLYLIPILANLFIIPLFLYAWRLGYPAAGLMGGLVATFSVSYYARTSVGWVDTDCLNLFFPWTASLLIVCMNAQQRRSTLLLLSAALGVTLFLYFRWYEKAAFAYLYWATLALHLALQRVRPRLLALCVATCVLLSHPIQAVLGAGNVAMLADRYLFGTSAISDFSPAARLFPDVMATVGELQRTDWMTALEAILAQPTAVMIGVLSCAVLAVGRWRNFVPLLPLMALGGLALVRGTRFAMYLAPFAGIGLGVLIEVAVRGFMAPRRSGTTPAPAANDRQPATQVAKGVAAMPGGRQILVAYAAVLVVFFAGLKGMTGIGQIRKPAIPTATVTALLELGQKLPPGTPLWTWWDYGYAIAHLTSLATYHDGGGQFTPQTEVAPQSRTGE